MNIYSTLAIGILNIFKEFEKYAEFKTTLSENIKTQMYEKIKQLLTSTEECNKKVVYFFILGL